MTSPLKAYSNLLKMEFEITKERDVIFKDGVKYTREEIERLRPQPSPEDMKAIHLVKKEFGGKIE